MARQRRKLSAEVVCLRLPLLNRTTPVECVTRHCQQTIDERVPFLSTVLADDWLTAHEIRADADVLQEIAKSRLSFVGFLGGIVCSTECFQIWLRDVVMVKFAVENPLDDLLRVPDFLLFLRKARIGDGTIGVATLLQPNSPVLFCAAAEAVLVAP